MTLRRFHRQAEPWPPEPPDRYPIGSVTTPPELPDEDDVPFERHDAPSRPLPIYTMRLTQSAHNEMLGYLSSGAPEMAGILLGPAAEEGLVTHFIPDRRGTSSPVSFRLDVASLNRELKRARVYRLDCKGVAHSHPAAGPIQPSSGDLQFLTNLFALPANAAAEQFFMPIIVGRRLYPYAYARGQVWPTHVFLV